mmetsp:Transcript_9710/g.34454  ORF Transcript_9710/g.34454 Transcript_9710/m.34454 type:complete len:91 (+) Transcript_9710:3-275(+)
MEARHQRTTNSTCACVRRGVVLCCEPHVRQHETDPPHVNETSTRAVEGKDGRKGVSGTDDGMPNRSNTLVVDANGRETPNGRGKRRTRQA